MKVGFLGAGSVAETLGAPLLRAGHSVKYASRNPEAPKIQDLLKKQPGATAATWPDTISWADALVLTTPGIREPAQYQQLAQQLGPGIKGKVLIDATNPLTAFPGLEVLWNGTSGGELLQQAVPDALVFKAFNSCGTPVMAGADGSLLLEDPAKADPLLAPLTMLYAGPTEQQEVAEGVIQGVGFKPQYVGPIRYARNLEAIAELWIHCAMAPVGFSNTSWGRDFHLQVLRKQ